MNNLLIKTSEGYKKFRGIQKIKKPAISICFEDVEKPLIMSLNQLIWSFNKWVPAKDMIVGQIIENAEKGFVVIKSIDFVGEIELYDILGSEVGHFQTGGFKAHNCDFIGSSKTLIRGDLLENLIAANSKVEKFDYTFKIYDEPRDKHIYLLGVDPAEGTKNDSSVIQVLDVTNAKKIKQVATFRDNVIDPYKFSDMVVAISEYYNNSEIIIESNSVGILVTNRIWRDLECDRLINMSENGKGLGVKSTKRSKKTANMNFKHFMENMWVELVDKDTISELGNYEEQPNGTYKCKEPNHDDTITALIWIFYYLESSYNENFESYQTNEVSKDVKQELSFTPIAVTNSDENKNENISYGNFNDTFVENENNNLEYLNFM